MMFEGWNYEDIIREREERMTRMRRQSRLLGIFSLVISVMAVVFLLFSVATSVATGHSRMDDGDVYMTGWVLPADVGIVQAAFERGKPIEHIEKP